MIIQLENDILKIKDKSLIIFDAETNTFKTITKDELLGEIRKDMEIHKKEFEVLQTQFNILQNAKLIENFKALKEHFDNDEIKEKLINYMAFQLLQNDINKGEIDIPENIEFVENWLKQPTAEIPDVLQKYIKELKGA